MDRKGSSSSEEQQGVSTPVVCIEAAQSCLYRHTEAKLSWQAESLGARGLGSWQADSLGARGWGCAGRQSLEARGATRQNTELAMPEESVDQTTQCNVQAVNPEAETKK